MLEKIYTERVGVPAETDQSSQFVVDNFIGKLPPNWKTAIPDFLQSKGFVFDRVKDRCENNPFFRQAVVLFVYYLSSKMTEQIKEILIVNQRDLKMVFGDLGIKFD